VLFGANGILFDGCLPRFDGFFFGFVEAVNSGLVADSDDRWF
jgi:hypothetical protein